MSGYKRLLILQLITLLSDINNLIIQWVKTQKQGGVETWEIQLPVSFSTSIYNIVHGMYKPNDYVGDIRGFYTISGLGLTAFNVWEPWGGPYGFFIVIGN